MKTMKSNQQGSDFPKLASPAQRALQNAGVMKLGDLARFSEGEVKEWHGIGPNALKQLREALRVKGLSFANKEK
jgi:hypothetical protein